MDKLTVIKDKDYLYINAVLKKYVGNSPDVKIPEGTVRIDNNAFKNCNFIKSVQIPKSVTTIGASAFEGCVSLEEITIPETVIHVEKNTFMSCSSLAKVHFLSKSKYISYGCFEECSNLSCVEIPDTVTRIKERAFLNCYNLKSVEIKGTKNNISHIEPFAFDECDSLEFLGCPGEKHEGAFFSDALEYIDESAFYKCKSIKNIEFGNSLKKINACAFSECKKLSCLTFPKSLEHIGGYAFFKCSSLSEITFNCESIEISVGAFSSNKSLTNVVFNGDVKEISFRAFQKCGEIKSVVPCKYLKNLSKTHFEGVFEESVVDEIVYSEAFVGSKLFSGLYKNPIKTFEKILNEKRHDRLKIFLDKADKLSDFCFDKMVELAEEKSDSEAVGMVVSTKNKLFPQEMLDAMELEEFEKSFGIKERTEEDWKKIFSYSVRADGIQISEYKSAKEKEVIIPSEIGGKSVVSIKEKAFRETDIVSVYIPESVKAIGESAFESCKSLISVNIPSGVTALRKNLFSGCVALDDVQFASLPLVIESGVFFDCNPRQIITEDGSRYLKCGDNPHYALVFSSDKSRQNSEYIHKDTKIICGGAFPERPSVEYSAYIPDGVVYVGERAFGGSITKKLIIPESVLELGQMAFVSCSKIEIVYMPASLKKLGEMLFSPFERRSITVGVKHGSKSEKYVLDHEMRFFHYTQIK